MEVANNIYTYTNACQMDLQGLSKYYLFDAERDDAKLVGTTKDGTQREASGAVMLDVQTFKISSNK